MQRKYTYYNVNLGFTGREIKKKQYSTYSEILAYMENKETDKEKVKIKKENVVKYNILKVLLSAGFTLLLIGVGSIVFLFK